MANVLQIAAAQQQAWSQSRKDEAGYTSVTTFWSDFTIADLMGGIPAVKDTYERAFYDWKENHIYITELILVLNHKCWYYYNNNDELSKLYSDLFYKAREYAYNHFEGDKLNYIYSTLD